MRRLYIFDFDGTICDSFAASLAVVRGLSPLFGMRRFDDSEIPALQRQSMGGMLASLELRSWKVPLMVWCARRQMRRHMPALRSFPGMPEVLAELRARGATTAILTSNAGGNVRWFLQRQGIAVDLVCAGSSLSGKASRLCRLLARLRVPPAAAIYVGDERRDIEAARAAGIACAAVTWGYNSEEALCALRPCFLVRRPRDLLELP